MSDDAARGQLRSDERGDVVVLSIDRPERRNALSRALLGAFATTLRSLDARPVRAVILQGSHECFSAGADLGELNGTLADLTMDDAIGDAASAIREVSVPVICSIEGPCVGAAVELAMACDLRVVSETAFFQLPAVRLGILYRPGAVAALSAQIPPAVLSRLLLFGDRLSAGDVATLGLAAPVVPRAGALARALELAAMLPEASSSAAVRASKRLLVALVRGEDISGFEDSRRALAASPERVGALDSARRRLSGGQD